MSTSLRHTGQPPEATPERTGDSAPASRFRQRVLFPAILLLIVLATIEAGAAVGTWVLAERHYMAYIPPFGDDEIAHFFASRDPILGWGAETNAAGEVTSPTPRPDPAATPGAAPCVSTYGDSFTFGEDEPEDASYPHFLALAAGCTVANYGVGGYGSDQALMLHRAQGRADSAPVVVLGHLSENMLRNLNQYRQLIYPGSTLHFKPRYVLDGDSLRYVPIAVQTPEDFRTLERDPAAVLRHEAFLVRPRREFPYTLALARWALGDFKLRARLRGLPYETEFYAADHPAGGLALTTRILATFAAEARARGQTPLVLLIPTQPDLIYARESGVFVDQPLADALARQGVPVLHAGPALLEALGGADPCTVFDGCRQHHFDARGNEMIARLVHERIASGLAPAR